MPRFLLSFVLSALFALSVAGAPEATKCQQVPGLPELLAPGAVLLLGEIHGTEQAPAFAANAACLAGAAGLPVKVALEVPEDHSESLKSFLASSGGEKDRGALLAGSFWSQITKDGRNSVAALTMLEELRKLKAAGTTIIPVLFDNRGSSGPDRESDMAERLLKAMKQDNQSQWIVLTGNVHSRVSKGVPWDSEFMPMGTYLLAGLKGRRITALDISHSGGEAWICRGGADSCGSQPMRPRAEPAQGWKVFIEGREPNQSGHHGRYFVGALTASPPAVPNSSKANEK